MKPNTAFTPELSRRYIELAWSELLISWRSFCLKEIVITLSVKIDEKYQELLENYKNGNQSQFPKEILEKDWEDMAVYALMGKLIEEGEWKS